MTLWNPPKFFHDFGYRPMIDNILTHDDYLSCRSPGADLHLRRLIAGDRFHLPPKFELFHSLATPVLPPTLGEMKLFYMGINWERLGEKQSRHENVLNLLDKTAMLRIYGPKELLGVKVWDGFQSYQHPLPFDGVSVINEIHRAGICLALSSPPHKDAVLMSNRLFEGLAAGALIICDENPWGRTHFGDSLLYVDMRDGADIVTKQIIAHVEWARENPDAAQALAARAQGIFRTRFIMDGSLASIYAGLQARKEELRARWRSKIGDALVRIVCLAPDPEDEDFERQVKVARTHSELGFQGVVLVDNHAVPAAARKLAADSCGVVQILGADFFQRDHQGSVVARNRLGGILKQVFAAAPQGALLCFVAPNETVFANHAGMLAATLRDDPAMDYAWSKVIRRDTDGEGEPRFAVETSLDLLSRDPIASIGLGRFMFRSDRFDGVLEYLLESLDVRAASGLAFHGAGCPTRHASLVVDTTSKCHLGIRVDPEIERNLHMELSHDLEAIRDLDPRHFDALDASTTLRDDIRNSLGLIGPYAKADPHAPIMPESLYLDRLSRANRRAIVLQLLSGLPVPDIIWRVSRQCFRAIRRTAHFVRGRRGEK